MSEGTEGSTEGQERLSTGQQKIKGYRDLTEDEIRMINMIKSTGVDVGELIEDVQVTPDVDLRWLAIARTHLQQGFMALTRAVAKPEGF